MKRTGFQLVLAITTFLVVIVSAQAPNQHVTKPITLQIKPHSVTLTWIASTSAVVGYNVYRATIPGGPYTKLNQVVIAGTTYTDPVVPAASTFYYVATAVSSGGVESTYSNEAKAVVP